MNIVKRIKHINKLIYNFVFTNKTRILTIQIIIMSAFIRMAILIVPMDKLEKHFGKMGKESPFEECYENCRTAYLIGKRVERVCDKTPWKSKCLVKALVAQKLIFKKGIHTTLYLGVEKADTKMTAHAWLRCGDVYITGGDGGKNAVVARFLK